ncbi:aspartate aminotransferase family protein, partial [Burkholderia cenocepacia]|nr:aspartate aminotransferase family protein [Burkholderia cenocepacia]MDR5668045.1 aspartate aminotransferase family protein [Burkholderia cenocepacia]
MDELSLLADADRRAHAYLAATNERRAFPDAAALAGLAAFDEPLPDAGRPADDVLRLLDEHG